MGYIVLYWIVLNFGVAVLLSVRSLPQIPVTHQPACLRKNLIYTYFQTHDHSVTDLLITPMHLKHSTYSKVK